jgi:hypothetical protein
MGIGRENSFEGKFAGEIFKRVPLQHRSKKTAHQQ